jgi:hypothetical protein
MHVFTREIATEKPPGSVLSELLTGLTEPLNRHGYKLQTQSEAALTYEHKYRPWYVWVLAVILFPIGALFLLISETATITITLEPKGDGTLVGVKGEGSREVEQAFEQTQI